MTALAPSSRALSIMRSIAWRRLSSSSSVYCGTSPWRNAVSPAPKDFAKPMLRTTRPNVSPRSRSTVVPSSPRAVVTGKVPDEDSDMTVILGKNVRAGLRPVAFTCRGALRKFRLWAITVPARPARPIPGPCAGKAGWGGQARSSAAGRPATAQEQAMASDPKIRASDADRDRTAAALREHLAAGRLTNEEFDERLDKTYAAKTLGDLDGLMADLPRTDLEQPADVPLHHAGSSPPLPEQRSDKSVQASGSRFSPAWRAAWG